MLAVTDSMLLLHIVWAGPPPLWGVRALEKQFKTQLDRNTKKTQKKGRKRQVTAVQSTVSAGWRFLMAPL